MQYHSFNVSHPTKQVKGQVTVKSPPLPLILFLIRQVFLNLLLIAWIILYLVDFLRKLLRDHKGHIIQSCKKVTRKQSSSLTFVQQNRYSSLFLILCISTRLNVGLWNSRAINIPSHPDTSPPSVYGEKMKGFFILCCIWAPPLSPPAQPFPNPLPA